MSNFHSSTFKKVIKIFSSSFDDLKMATHLYLEQYLDSLESLPAELRRNFTLMHDLVSLNSIWFKNVWALSLAIICWALALAGCFRKKHWTPFKPLDFYPRSWVKLLLVLLQDLRPLMAWSPVELQKAALLCKLKPWNQALVWSQITLARA